MAYNLLDAASGTVTEPMKSTKVVIHEMNIGGHGLTLDPPIRVTHPEEKLLFLVLGKDDKVIHKVALDLGAVIKAAGK